MHVVPRIMRQPEAFLDPQNAPKSLTAGASPQTPLGELTALPQTPSWIQGVLLLRGGEERGEEGKGGEGKGGKGRGGDGGEGLPRLEITSGYALGCISPFAQIYPTNGLSPTFACKVWSVVSQC